MNKNLKIALGIGIATAAVTAITIGVIRQLKAIKSLTIEAEELPDELGLEDCDLALEEPAEEEEVAEEVAE